MVVDPKLIGISGKIGNGKDLLFDVINYVITEDYWTSFEHYMYESRKVDEVYENKKFASILKDITGKLIGCHPSQLEDREFKEKELGEEWWYYCNSLFFDGETKMVSYSEADDNIKNNTSWYIVKLTPRKLLQLLGTEAGRHIIHPNIWVNALFADYNPLGFDYKGSVDKEIKGSWVYPNWIVTDVRFPNEANIIKDKGGIMIRINRSQFMIDGKVILKDEHASETGLDDYDKFDYVIDNDGTVQDLIDKVKSLNIVERIL